MSYMNSVNHDVMIAPRRVLVIDDHAEAADGMAMLVSAMGGESRAAYSGENGLKQVEEFHPDVVLLDISMPGIDGYETCRRIRRDLGASVLVIAVTGLGHDEDIEEATRAGFDAHVTKPVNPTSLMRLLTETDSKNVQDIAFALRRPGGDG